MAGNGSRDPQRQECRGGSTIILQAGESDHAESKNSAHVPAARGLLELKENSAQLAEQKSQNRKEGPCQICKKGGNLSISLSLEGSKEEASFQVQSPGLFITHSPPSLQNHN